MPAYSLPSVIDRRTQSALIACSECASEFAHLTAEVGMGASDGHMSDREAQRVRASIVSLEAHLASLKAIVR